MTTRRNKPAARLPLSKRKFKVYLVEEGEENRVEFVVPDGSQLFSQAVEGEKILFSEDGKTSLHIEWTHPDLEEHKLVRAATVQRHARNDLREVSIHLVRQKYEEFMSEVVQDETTGCLQLPENRYDKAGYARCTISDVHFRFTHVVLFVEGKGTIQDFAEESDTELHLVDASHLCGNERCVSVDHLSLEPRKVNIERRKCHRTLQCSGHYPYKQCLLNL